MEFLKQIINENDVYSIVDIFNRKKYQVSHYLEFLLKEDSGKNHLAEIPLFPSPLIVDVDIKKEKKDVENINEKLYDESVIEEIILSYTKILDDVLFDCPEEYKILLLEKPPKITEDGYIKNGFHLHFISISLSKEDLKTVYRMVQEISEYSDYLDDVSSKPWLLYGHVKSPEDNPYLITKGYIVRNENLKEVSDKYSFFYGEKYFNILIDKENIYTYIKALMSIRNIKNFSLTIPNKINYSLVPENNSKDKFNKEILTAPVKNHINISCEKIADIIMTLKDSRAEDYNQWIEIAFIITSIAKTKEESDRDFLKGVFHTFSRKSSKYNDIVCEQKWNTLMRSNYEGGLGIGSLIFMAKEDGNFSNIKEIVCNFSLEHIPVNDYDIANMVKSSITQLYITHKDHGCYKLETTAWREVSGWDSIFKKHITEWFDFYFKKIQSKLNMLKQEINDMTSSEDDSSENKNRINIKTNELECCMKSCGSLRKKIKNYSSLNNISKSLFDLYFDENLPKLFEQKDDIIAFKNCVFDFKNWKFTSGNPSHYILNRIEHEIIDWDSVSYKDKEIVFDFFRKIFPDKGLRIYSIKNFARILTGQNTFKQFQFWTGSGNNGKSVCISLTEYIFGRMCMKVPKSMVTGAPHKQGGTNPELYRLKDARVAIIDEVTKNDYLDPGQIKGLTGNDKLFGRDLFQRSKDIKEITPMFFPILITNEIPIIKHPDDATWNRIRLINFESVFTSNVEKYIETHPNANPEKIFKRDSRICETLKSKSKYFLSYLMSILLQFESFEDFNSEEIIPDKVIEGLENFKMGQNVLTQFLEENYIVDSKSTEIFTYHRLLRDYLSTKPKIHLGLEDVDSALKSYQTKYPEIILFDKKVKGLIKVD